MFIDVDPFEFRGGDVVWVFGIWGRYSMGYNRITMDIENKATFNLNLYFCYEC